MSEQGRDRKGERDRSNQSEQCGVGKKVITVSRLAAAEAEAEAVSRGSRFHIRG